MKSLLFYLAVQVAIIVGLIITATPKELAIGVAFVVIIFWGFVAVTRWLGFGADSKKHTDQGG